MKLVKKSRNRIQGGVTLAVFGIVILAGCKPASTQSPAPPTVKVATETQGDPVIYHEWIGTSDGLVNAQIRAQVSGYPEEIAPLAVFLASDKASWITGEVIAASGGL